MADPHHVSTLDGHDRLTVVAYRLGIALAAVGLLACSVAFVLGTGQLAAELVVTTGAAIAVANLHLYDKRVRWLIGVFGAAGLLLQAVGQAGPGIVVFHAGLGFSFAALSALALKEQFCFKIPGLRLVPLFLATSLVPMLAGWPIPAAVLLGLSGLVLSFLAVAKWSQPLHFDIGDKSRYAV